MVRREVWSATVLSTPHEMKPMTPDSRTSPLLGRGSWPESARIAEILRKETVGGILLLVATVLALAWANSPWADS